MADGLEDKISLLVSQMAVNNSQLMAIVGEVQKHSSIIFGDTSVGGLVTRGNVLESRMDEQDKMLAQLTKNCDTISGFVEGQNKINETQRDTNRIIGRAMIAMGMAIFVVLLLVGAADIHVLEAILGGIHP